VDDRSKLDEAFHKAKALDPDDRLRLIARLWASLPVDHWAAPTAKDLAEVNALLGDYDTQRMADVPWKVVRQMAGTQPAAPTSKIYSAPRRFDLATILIVTFAYSLLFAALSLLQLPPEASLIVGGFITLVGVGQAVFFGGRRPRLASIVIGLGICLTYWFVGWRFLWRAYSFDVIGLLLIAWTITGLLGGYIAGTMVGGVFLIVDLVRSGWESFRPTAPDDADEPSASDGN
jgi:hypothetical protein